MKEIEYKNKKYKSLSALARHLDISISSFAHKIKIGQTVDQIIKSHKLNQRKNWSLFPEELKNYVVSKYFDQKEWQLYRTKGGHKLKYPMSWVAEQLQVHTQTAKKLLQQTPEYKKYGFRPILTDRESKDKANDYERNKRKENPEFRKLHNARNRDYRKNREDKARTLLRKRERFQRIKNDDPAAYAIHRIRGNIWLYLNHRDHKSFKPNSVTELLGINKIGKDGFKKYIENLFYDEPSGLKRKMTWENRGEGGWDYGHIRPIASFDLSDPDQFKKCWHYTNFKPQWHQENLEQGSYWDGKRWIKGVPAEEYYNEN